MDCHPDASTAFKAHSSAADPFHPPDTTHRLNHAFDALAALCTKARHSAAAVALTITTSSIDLYFAPNETMQSDTVEHLVAVWALVKGDVRKCTTFVRTFYWPQL